MDTTTGVVVTGVISTVGTWSEGKPLTMRLAIGATVLALSLSLMSGYNEKLASQFATLILLAALFRYVPSIVKKTGIAS